MTAIESSYFRLDCLIKNHVTLSGFTFGFYYEYLCLPYSMYVHGKHGRLSATESFCSSIWNSIHNWKSVSPKQ